MVLKLVIFLHIICATIWAVGYLILFFVPKSIKNKNFSIIEHFESKFERFGIPVQFVLIPKRNLNPLSYHIILVTPLAIPVVFVGFSTKSVGLL